MIRGRHRGLPVRIDRSIMLPSELEGAQEPATEDEYDGEWQSAAVVEEEATTLDPLEHRQGSAIELEEPRRESAEIEEIGKAMA